MALIDKLTALADSIRAKTGTTEKLTLDQMMTHVNNIEKMPETVILVDESGNEIPAVFTEEEITITATANDIRAGTIAVTNDGVIEGTKEIPAYYTTEGIGIITAGSQFKVRIPNGRHEYTKLQALFCALNDTPSKSVATDRVGIASSVYAVNSTEVVSTITPDNDSESIDFGVTNDSGSTYVIRYFTYKEEY